ncbi:hypothetical protein D3C78_1474140 [compost metagenome]
MADFTQGMHLTITAVTHYAARGMGALLQGVQGDLIGIGEAGFLAAHGAYSNPLVDIVRAILDDTVFNHPGFVVARLEIEIGVIEAAFGQLPQDGKQILVAQLIGSK